MEDREASAGTAARGTRRDRAAVIAAARLCVVPLSVGASVAAGDPILEESHFLALAVAAQLYAVVLWFLVRSGRAPRPAVAEPLDVLVVLALVLVADPHEAAAGRWPVMLLFITWSLMLPPRELLPRGVAVSVLIGGVEMLEHGGSEALGVGIFLAVVVFICALIAARVTERLRRLADVARRAQELQADVEELEARERARIAQLLHDDALQRLLAARQELEGAAGDPEALGRVADGLAEATRAMRNLTLVVNDEALEAAGVVSAVERIARDAGVRSSLATELRVDPTIDGSVGPIILPMVRELVANVERHARASVLIVEVVREPAGLRLSVADDGVGFTKAALTEAARAGHLGHVGLRRRVEELQGALDIETGPGRGSRITVRIRHSAIEARRELEASLRREREWNAALVAGFPDPFVVISDELRIVDVSDRFTSVTGWSRAELLAAPPARFPYIPPTRMDEVAAQIRDAATLDDHTAESELYCRDGRRIAVIVSVRRVQDPRGGRRLRLVTFKDISERRAAEQRLIAERDLSTAIRGAMQEPFLQTHDGRVIAVNDAFCALTGFTEDELIGAERPYFFIRTATLDDAFVYAARLDAEGTAEVDLLALRADGEEVAIHVRGVTVRDEHGVAIGRVQTVHPHEGAPPLGPRKPGIVPAERLAT